MFFDDGSAGAGTVEETVRVAGVLTETLERAGWKINVEKSCLVPSQKPTILGFVLDLVHGRVSVAEARVLRFLEHLRVLHSKRRPNAKECARLAGFIISMSFAIGPVARLRTRALYDMILRRKSWFHRQEWSDEAYAEVSFWWYCFNEFHGRLVVGDPKITAVVDTWSDASDVAWGGFAVSCGETIARGNWPEEVLEAQKSSTWRELRATELVLQSVVQELAGKECRHRTDNQAAARILQVGSKVPELQEIACRIFRFCRQNCIRLVPEWVPREENVLADFLSKVVDTDDWKLSSEVFDEIDGLWGPHTVDCFASAESAQLPRFCSRWWNPGCLAVDAFTMCWEGENLWLCPPIYLIGDVISRISVIVSHGTLVVPKWTSAWWWPYLFKGTESSTLVRSFIFLPRISGLFDSGSCQWNWFDGKVPRCEVMAIRFCSIMGCRCCETECRE
eukprot:scpid80623/ scgid31136/ 